MQFELLLSCLVIIVGCRIVKFCSENDIGTYIWRNFSMASSSNDTSMLSPSESMNIKLVAKSVRWYDICVETFVLILPIRDLQLKRCEAVYNIMTHAATLRVAASMCPKQKMRCEDHIPYWLAILSTAWRTKTRTEPFLQWWLVSVEERWFLNVHEGLDPLSAIHMTVKFKDYLFYFLGPSLRISPPEKRSECGSHPSADKTVYS